MMMMIRGGFRWGSCRVGAGGGGGGGGGGGSVDLPLTKKFIFMGILDKLDKFRILYLP